MRNRVHTETALSTQERHSSLQTSHNELQPEGEPEKSLTLMNLKLRIKINEMVKKIKYLSPPHSLPYKIDEEWERPEEDVRHLPEEEESNVSVKQTLSEQMANRHQYIRLLRVFQGIVIVIFLWILSVAISFHAYVGEEIACVVVIWTLGKLGIDMLIAWYDREEESTYAVDWLQDFVEPVMLIGAAVLIIIRNYSRDEVLEYIFSIYSCVVIFSQLRQIGKKFELVTIYAQQNKKRKELRIIQLFGLTLSMAHLFALIMYSMSELSVMKGYESWIQKANLENNPWYILYVYSFYWSNTTMVTVGYGDLTPANPIEAIVITMIQVVGTAIFGYMINVIGITVNEIQKKNIQFEEHQSTIYKLKEHYQLSRELCLKMKNDIKKKQNLLHSIPLKNNEEKQFLDYIQPNLKEQFVLETNMKVIKKSIFFLTHFTVNFQNQIAIKLIRFIYKPEEVISIQDEANTERQLVIINNGKVNIYAHKHHHNVDLEKLVRVIQPKEGKPNLNVFGYSSLILNRNVPLRAVTMKTATAYLLKRKDILECIGKSLLDFESFSQLRERMLSACRIEEIEAPSIKEQEKHYVPNVFLLLKKIKYETQQRVQAVRSKRRCPCKIVTVHHYQNKTLLMIESNKRIDEEDCESAPFIGFNDQEAGTDEIKKDEKTLLVMDQAAIFENFLKRYNLNKVASDYERFCLRKGYQHRPKGSTLNPKRRMTLKGPLPARGSHEALSGK